MAKPNDPQAPAQGPDTRQKTAREQRLAKALRENLRRRKAPGAPPAEPIDEGRS
jgi:hypothetical protein